MTISTPSKRLGTKSLFDVDFSSSKEWVESGDSLDDVEIGLEEAEDNPLSSK